jgi:acyl carrier protein
MDTMESEIREVLAEHGRLPVDVSTLSDGADLYQLGLSSHSSVNVMLALEDKFGVEFPDTMLRKSTFQSVSAIRDALGSLGTAAKAI